MVLVIQVVSGGDISCAVTPIKESECFVLKSSKKKKDISSLLWPIYGLNLCRLS